MSGFCTWSFQKPEIRKTKTATDRYWKTAIFPEASFGSSRMRASGPSSPCVLFSVSFPDNGLKRLVRSRQFHSIENCKKRNSYYRIQCTVDEGFPSIERDGLP